MTARPTSSEPAPSVTLRCQVTPGVAVLGRDRPRLSWRIESDLPSISQESYEVQAAPDPDFDAVLATTGEIDSAEQIGIEAPGEPLHSREVRFYRVRLRTAAGWTNWTAPLRVEAGLLLASDWRAVAITLPADPGAERPSPAPLLRREFAVDGTVVRARLYATALGMCSLSINGRRVSGDLLSPGWTAYRSRLLHDTYDVTDLLVEGPNVMAAMLGDGWYRGRLGWEPYGRRGRYGTELGLIAQLEVELTDGGQFVLATDGTWRASTGEVRMADIYDGCDIDLRERQTGWDRPGFDDAAWSPARIIAFDLGRVEPRVAPPVRPVMVIPVKTADIGPGRWQLDGGQNIAGFVRLRVHGARGASVVVRHAEVLEPGGALHTRSLRSARATDAYVLADDQEVVLEPAFTFHGFRYAEVETEADLVAAEFVAISSDLAPRASFACSDDTLNRFVENVVWSQRDNFVSVPTDCPQRDERLGWTGDAQAFAATACVLFDAQSFWTSWLRDLALDQDPTLGVPTVVPDVVLDGESRFGRAGWADAATIVPWAVYESFGDPDVLRTQFESMRSHVRSLVHRQGADGLLEPAMQFGDWLDPDAPADRPAEAKADPTFLANAFFAHSASLVADAARVLCRPDVEEEHRSIAERVSQAAWRRWRDHAVTNQTGCAIALRFGIVPSDERALVAGALAQLVREANGRVATGFLGTPLVLPALAACGYYEEAYLMLLCREVPSWLYQVEQGATTVWERWDAIRPDGSLHPGKMTHEQKFISNDADEGQMLSFNHYAYGAVVDWIYRRLAGIAPDAREPGYRHIVFAPHPPASVDWARASVDTPYGLAAIEWRRAAGQLHVDLTIPVGAHGSFVAPTETGSCAEPDGKRVALAPGRHHITVRHGAEGLSIKQVTVDAGSGIDAAVEGAALDDQAMPSQPAGSSVSRADARQTQPPTR